MPKPMTDGEILFRVYTDLKQAHVKAYLYRRATVSPHSEVRAYYANGYEFYSTYLEESEAT